MTKAERYRCVRCHRHRKNTRWYRHNKNVWDVQAQEVVHAKTKKTG